MSKSCKTVELFTINKIFKINLIIVMHENNDFHNTAYK